MKIYSSLIVSFLFAITAASYAETALFEGIFEAHGEGPGVTNTAFVHMNGNKARLYLQNQAAATNGLPILDYDKMKIFLLADKEKYYLEMPLDAMESALTAEPLVLKPTGKKETFVTLNAEEFKGTDKETGVSIVALGTKDIVSKVNILVSFQKLSQDGLAVSKTGRALLNMGYFPVRVFATKGGQNVFTWEIKSVEKKKVELSQFEVPSGYMKFSEYMKKNIKSRRGR